MSKYPRLPTGPSPLGAAGARSLDRGGAFQVSRPAAGVTARRAGEFRRVEVDGGPEYATRDNGNTGERLVRDTDRLQTKFRKSRISVFGTHLGGNSYVAARRIDSGTPFDQTYSYPIPSEAYWVDGDGVTRLAGLYDVRTIGVTDGVFRIVVGGLNRTVKGLIDLPFDDLEMREVGGTGSPPRMVSAGPIRTGVVPTATGVGQCAVVLPRWLGRTDPQSGRPLIDLILYEVGTDAVAYATTLTTGRPETEFYPYAHVIATRGRIHVLAAERGTFVRPPGATPPTPRWLMFTLDVETGVLATTDLTSADPVDLTDMTTWNGVYDAAHDRVWRVVSRYRGETTLSVVLPSGTAVIALRTSGADPEGLVRIARIALGGSPTLAGTQLLPILEPLEEPDPFEYAPGAFAAVAGHTNIPLSLTHLGGDKLLMTANRRRRWSLGVLESHIRFLYSSDGGSSWALVTPTGFDVPEPDVRFFGTPTIHRPATEDREAVVLITAWSNTEQTYYVYESEDNCATWRRRARIAAPDGIFRPVFGRDYGWELYLDQPTAGDQYRELIRGPSYTRPLDIAYPKRYTKD